MDADLNSTYVTGGGPPSSSTNPHGGIFLHYVMVGTLASIFYYLSTVRHLVF
jgi:hypothetical protein